MAYTFIATLKVTLWRVLESRLRSISYIAIKPCLEVQDNSLLAMAPRSIIVDIGVIRT
ncbi:hypothetical protein D3C71_1995670 [compost metagenome]